MGLLDLKGIENWNYTDKIMFGNTAEMINRDMQATMNGWPNFKGENPEETNPILKGNTDNPNFVGAYGLLMTGLLGDRWLNMENPTQRQIEMLIAQAVEAMALNNSGEPWKVQYGFEF